MTLPFVKLGRQPRFARAWFSRYQDRIVFGKDITEAMSEYQVYFRVLETADEYSITIVRDTRSGKCTDWSCRMMY